MGWWKTDNVRIGSGSEWDSSRGDNVAYAELMQDNFANMVTGLNGNWRHQTTRYNTGRVATIMTYYSTNTPIVAVNVGAKTFTITGAQSANLAAGMPVQVVGSTGNDGTYYVVSFAPNGGNTDVTVDEAIPSAVADGDMYVGGGAQMCMCSGSSSNYPALADNMFRGGYRVGGTVPHISFKPSSHNAFYDKISDTVNPNIVSTYCVDAEAYRFTRFMPIYYDYDGWDVYNGYLYVVVHEDHAGIIFLVEYYSDAYSGWRDTFYVIDDALQGFSIMQDPADTEQSWMGGFSLYSNAPAYYTETAGDDNADACHVSCFDKDGYIVEKMLIHARTSGTSYLYEPHGQKYMRGRYSMSKAVTSVETGAGLNPNGWRQGRKGIINPDILCFLRRDARQNTQFSDSTGNWFLHRRYGLVLPWGNNESPPRN